MKKTLEEWDYFWNRKRMTRQASLGAENV
ncbi:hypothetical protein LCGC14_1943960, partial [marine sediment metagenome]